jgi:DNA mismatch endonuclease (patch repair protein)
MSRIRSKHTKPEYIVRKALTKLGIRFKLHAKKLPGKPDIVIGSKKKIIFINGCFWHQHKGCKRRSTPKSNVAYWSKKLKRNVAKQKADIKALNKMEWKSIIIWECQTKNEKSLIKRLNKI